MFRFHRPWRQGGDLAQQLYRPKKGGDNDIYGEDLDNVIKTNRLVMKFVSHEDDGEQFSKICVC